jgi:starch-binding outer membrane protein, SusD/RagB family
LITLKIEMMKKIILILMIIQSLLSACQSVIDLAPVSSVNADNFYRNAQDIELGVLTAYDALQSIGQYGQYFIYFMEVSSDNSFQSSITTSGGVFGDFDVWRVVPTNAVLDKTWKDCYVGIQRCNIILNRIEPISMDETLKASRKGEMKFIRALTYFNLVRIWGDVPLVIQEIEDPFDAFQQGRTDKDLVYQQIIKDLQEAIDELPLIPTDIGRVSRGAAQTLLAKVYLTQKKYSEAIVLLKEVLNSHQYRLLDNFASVFSTQNENNQESIFEVQFKKGGLEEGSPYANLFAPSGASQLIGNVGTTMGENLPTDGLFNTYSANDLRRNATIGKLLDNRLYAEKYRDTPFQDRDGENNFIVLRYADVLLMLAETLNETQYIPEGEAFDYLNEIRLRANLPALTATELPNQNAFREAVWKERRLELAFENHRWFDLLRTGKAIEVMNQHTSPNGKVIIELHQLLLPIPQSQIDTNPDKIFQNTGY